jgi:glyoxylase I family protein
MIKPKSFSHCGLRISDVTRARDFYENVLGLKTLPRPDFKFGGAWYGVGENQIHLISAEARSGGINPLGPHLAIQVDDYEAAKADLKARGIEFLEAPPNMGGHQLWILDPDGNTIELRSEK